MGKSLLNVSSFITAIDDFIVFLVMNMFFAHVQQATGVGTPHGGSRPHTKTRTRVSNFPSLYQIRNMGQFMCS